MHDDNDQQQEQQSKTLEVKTIKTFAELLRFKKATDVAIICFCVPEDPSCASFIGSLGSAGSLIASENETVGVGIIDVDSTSEDVCGTFKIKAMPSTLFFREARETARVEGCDINELRKHVTAHLISAASKPSDKNIKKNNSGEDTSNTDAQQQQPSSSSAPSDIRIVNAYFGDLDAGNFADVTDTVRKLRERDPNRCVVVATREFLGCTSSLEGTENNNKLRIVVDRLGVGKTFTVVEGKQLELGKEIDFFFKQHAGNDVFDQRESADAHGDADFTNFANPYGGLPVIPKPENSRR